MRPRPQVEVYLKKACTGNNDAAWNKYVKGAEMSLLTEWCARAGSRAACLRLQNLAQPRGPPAAPCGPVAKRETGSLQQGISPEGPMPASHPAPRTAA